MPSAMSDESKPSTNRRRAEISPMSLPPIGISREQAAAFIGVSATTFDKMVAARSMPEPRVPSPGRTVWDVDDLVAAFKRLPYRNDENPDFSALSTNPWDDA